jgi:stearoyl-CoA desaturase (delta-9 desaturase)
MALTETLSANWITRRRREVSTFSRRQAVVIGLTHALAAVAFLLPSRTAMIAFLATYAITGFGVSLGFHRGLAHGAFRSSPFVRGALAIAGTLAFQGGPITWVGFHRAHHRHTDEIGDPHAASRGFFWSHMGWAFHKGPNGYRRQKMRGLTASLERDAFLRLLERHCLLLNFALFALTWIVFGTSVALWAFPLRIAVLWHVTWLTNSFAHGAHLGQSEPRNVWWLALIGFGEGLHANHHAVPSSPSFARGSCDVDPGFWVLCVLAHLKLVHLARSRAAFGASPSRALPS